MKKLLKLLAIFLLFSSIISSSAMASSTRTITDMTGEKIKIPKKVNRVADLWHANNQVVLLLGGQNKLVATTPLVKKQHWFTMVDPKIAKVAAPLAGNQIQVEELVKIKPDVVIASDQAQIKESRQAKLPTVNAMYTDFAGLKKSVTLTAEILGGNSPKIARQYNKELTNNINLFKQHLKSRKSTQRFFILLMQQILPRLTDKKQLLTNGLN